MAKVDAFNHPDDEAVGGQYPFWNPHFHGKGQTKREGRKGDFLMGTILDVRKGEGNVKYFVDVDIQEPVDGRDPGATVNGKPVSSNCVTWSLNKTYENIGQELSGKIGHFLTVRYDGERKIKGRSEAMAEWVPVVSKQKVVAEDERL